MVRVMPVHNFSGQSVAAIEEPTASCTAKYNDREMLLLALSSHCIEVHELMMPQPKVSTVFPTVDSVNQMIHCNKENYVVTVESKCSRDGMSVNNFVRIYVNWALGGNQNQAMRARIAGRVTPSSNRLSNSLEMIELPLSGQPTTIACCQVTGNLLVATGETAVLHELKVEKQALSKRKFIDFEARPWSLGFPFSPTCMEIAEDFFLVRNSQNFMVFRLMNQLYEDIDLLGSSNSAESSMITKSSSSDKSTKIEKSRDIQNHPIDSLNSLNETQRNSRIELNHNQFSGAWNDSISVNNLGDSSSYLDWDELACETNNEKSPKSPSTTNEKNQNFCIELPALKSESHKPDSISNPFVTNAPELNVFIKTTSPADGWSENYVVKRLLQLKISDMNDSPRNLDCSEYFTCSFLKPIYLKRENNACNPKKCTLRSDRYKNLNGASCIVCTVQEGYLFYFPSQSTKNFNATCTPYPFTAPVTNVTLEDTVLHALTEAGLESYTLRLSYDDPTKSVNPSKNVTTADIEPVSLIGLRPFMGVQRLLHIDRYIILLTRDENHWTLYTLCLPSPEDLYYDILSAAMNHKTSSPSTYRHLLGEAYMIANLSKDVDNRILENNRNDDEKSANKLEILYRKSCALLADYYVNSESPNDWSHCVPYFKMSRLGAIDVLSEKSMYEAPGIGVYLTEALLNLKSGAEADALFQLHNVVEIISTNDKKRLVRLIFGSSVLREYATEKLINILLSIEQNDSTRFALVLLYVQADRQEQAESTIKPISNNCILTMSLQHWRCLFDVTLERHNNHVIATFSDFSVILMRQKSPVFADILVKIIDADAVSLHQILQIFLAHLPSRVGRDGHVAAAALQLFVETYLRGYFNSLSNEKMNDNTKREKIHYDYSIVEAFKILVRSYLGKLSQTNVYGIEDCRTELEIGDAKEYLFEKFRPLYLDKLTSTIHKDCNNPTMPQRRDKLMRNEILKLQALLASGYLPDECLLEIEEFLKAHKIDGDLSFRLLCVNNTEGTLILMENCPQGLLQYAKERYHEESEWKHLVQMLYEKISTEENNPDICSPHNQALEDTLIHLSRTMSLKGLQRLLSNESTTILQRYGDICSQIMHADHVNSMIIGTGQHLLFNINV